MDFAGNVHTIKAIDTSFKMIEVARKRASEKNISNINFENINIFDDSFKDESFNVNTALLRVCYWHEATPQIVESYSA